MAEGTLAPSRFGTYIQQDAIYLRGFARALTLASARAPSSESAAFWSRQAGESIQIERHLHETMFARFGIDAAAAEAEEPAPATLAYVSYLLALAYQEPYEVLVAGLLPCYWVYQKVGGSVLERGRPDNPYQAWIDTYAGEEYGAIVNTVVEATDRLAATASPDLVARMLRAFVLATRLEWWFWDGAYREERWPAE